MLAFFASACGETNDEQTQSIPSLTNSETTQANPAATTTPETQATETLPADTQVPDQLAAVDLPDNEKLNAKVAEITEESSITLQRIVELNPVTDAANFEATIEVGQSHVYYIAAPAQARLFAELFPLSGQARMTYIRENGRTTGRSSDLLISSYTAEGFYAVVVQTGEQTDTYTLDFSLTR